MKKKWVLILKYIYLGFSQHVVKRKGKRSATEDQELGATLVKLTVTKSVDVGETVEMSALVTVRGGKDRGCRKVVYEVWEERKRNLKVK